LLSKVIRNLFLYFGLYFLSQQLDQSVKIADFENLNILTAVAALNSFFAIQLFLNFRSRRAIEAANKKKGEPETGTFASLMSSTGLTTIINALTQTTTTLCANGQCFTIYSNTIASNLAAFGVSVTSINLYLVPLCCLLLCYSLWTLYKDKRSCTYKPFMLGLFGCVCIIFDNFLFGEALNLHNIPSWAGNASLIIAAIWAGRDNAKENNNAFGF